jgi:hypothetical protein
MIIDQIKRLHKPSSITILVLNTLQPDFIFRMGRIGSHCCGKARSKTAGKPAAQWAKLPEHFCGWIVAIVSGSGSAFSIAAFISSTIGLGFEGRLVDLPLTVCK